MIEVTYKNAIEEIDKEVEFTMVDESDLSTITWLSEKKLKTKDIEDKKREMDLVYAEKERVKKVNYVIDDALDKATEMFSHLEVSTFLEQVEEAKNFKKSGVAEVGGYIQRLSEARGESEAVFADKIIAKHIAYKKQKIDMLIFKIQRG